MVIAKLKPECLTKWGGLAAEMPTWQETESKWLFEQGGRIYTLKLGLYEAVSHFNIGAVAVVKFFQALDIPCKYTKEGYRLQDLLSVDIAQHKSKYQEEIKSDQRPQKKKNYQNKQNQGVNHSPGQF